MRIWKTALLTAAVAAMSLQAAPVLTLSPSGDLTGAPGGTVTWNFNLTSDSNEWVTIISSFPLFESNPLLGFYTDLIGQLGGPDNGLLPPGAPDWTGALGEYTIDPLAQVNDFNTGTLLVLYETFSADPQSCIDCRTGDGMLQAAFTVTVGQEIPEPGTWLTLASGLVLIAASLRRSRRA